MRKLAEKIVLIALICVSLIFVITAVLYMSNLIPQSQNWTDNGVVNVVMLVLAVAFVGMSAYLIYVNFSQNANIKRILLYSDCCSQTSANSNVVQNIVKGCAKRIDGLKVKKIKVHQNEKHGFVLTVNVVTDADNAQQKVDDMRLLLDESFKTTLGLTFASIDFVITKLSSKYRPAPLPQAEQTALPPEEQAPALSQDDDVSDTEEAPQQEELAVETDDSSTEEDATQSETEE